MPRGTQIGSVFTSLTLESQSFFVDLAKVNAKTQASVASIQKQISGLSTGFRNLFAVMGGAALLGATKRALDYAGSLGEVSQQLGVTSRDLQVFRYIGGQVGIETEEMDKGLQKLTRSMGEADVGSKKQATAFRELGVSVRDAKGELLTAGQVLPKLAEALSQIKDPATRARLEVQLFGKTGQQLDTLLTQGAKGIAEFTKRAEDMGLVLGDDLVKAADAASDRIRELKDQLEVRFARLVAENADAILGLANAFASLTEQVIRFIGKAPQLLAVFAGLGIGARVAGAPGAIVGGLSGTLAGLYNRAMNDPTGAKGEADKELVDRINRNRKDLREMREAGLAETDDFKQFALIDQGLMAEYNKRLAARRGGGAKPVTATSLDGALPTVKGDPKKSSGPTPAEIAAKREELRLEFEIDRAKARGDDAREAALQRDLDLNHRIKELVDAKYTREEATTIALKERSQLMWDHIAANIKAVQIADQEQGLEEARIRGDVEKARLIEDEQYRRERIAFWQKTGLDLTAAQGRAERDLLGVTEARADAERKAAEEQERSRQIELARARGDSPARINALESADSVARRTDELKRAGKSPEDAQAQAQREALEMNRAYATGYWRSTVHDGFRAALDGNFGSWFEGWWKDRLSNAMEDALNSVADLIAKLFKVDVSGSPSSGGGGFGGLFSAFSSLFGGGGGAGGLQGAADGANAGLAGFASGGSFMAGGMGGIDRNVLSINGIPRVKISATERVSVEPMGGRGTSRGGTTVYDLRGSFVAEGLIEQIRGLAANDAATMIAGARRSMATASRNALA